MSKGLGILLGIGGVILLAILWVMGAYNGLVSTQEEVKNRWADVETQYQRRMDLIPNIVASVKGSANFEQGTLEKVIEARSAWAKAKTGGDVGGQIAAANSFDSALSRLLVTVEAYPDLKSTQAFRDLNTALEGTENRIAVARKDFNASVKVYNLGIRQFPSVIIASIFNFKEWAFFESEEGAEKAPKVEFDFNGSAAPVVPAPAAPATGTPAPAVAPAVQ